MQPEKFICRKLLPNSHRSGPTFYLFLNDFRTNIKFGVFNIHAKNLQKKFLGVKLALFGAF
jgi:hypothetical protein